jgi:RNA polymerase sigma factor (sigma-70 family)
MPKPMTESKDAELLRAYADEKSEPAFGELVRRHVNLVYSVALRQCGGDAHLAEDVAQRVFTDLARKARSLSGHTVLGGWLYRSAQFAASDVVRAERRRRAREQEAHAMEETNRPDSAAGHADWQKLAPVLDQAIGELAAPDRDAVVLRFFEGRPFAEIGATLRLSDDAARMRVERALDKLRVALERRGITSTTAALGIALANQAGAAAPAGVAASVIGAALAGASAAAGGGVGAWAAVLTMSKINTMIVGAFVVAGLATAVVEVRANRGLRMEVNSLRAAEAELSRLRIENRTLKDDFEKRAAGSPVAAALMRAESPPASVPARPSWVKDSMMRPVAAATNAGWSTAAAALETLMWAKAGGDRGELVRNFAWVGDAKTKADAAFAQLSEAVRTKYGSADRLAGEVAFGRDESQVDPVVAYAPGLDPEAKFARPGTIWRFRGWARLASGNERPLVTDLCYAGGTWTVGTSQFTEQKWQAIVAQIDPATGELLAARR